MTIVIKKNTSKETIEKILLKISTLKKEKGLRKFFGKPIADIGEMDAVTYQKKLRNEWD